MRRHLFAIAAAGILSGALALPTLADPGKAKNASHIQAICGTQTVNVITNGNGKWTPAHVVGSTKVFVPTAFSLTFTFTPTHGGAAQTDTENIHKASPTHRGTVMCTIPLQTLASGPQGTMTIQGTVTGFCTPAKSS